jgi:hypothetical protein
VTAKKLDRLYIRWDATFPDDEKYQAIPPKLRDSAFLFLAALNGWSRDKRTDGRVPMRIAHTIGRKMEHPPHKVTTFLAALAAEDVKLVELLADEVLILKYRKWQDTREEIEGKAEAKQRAGREGGMASGRSRREAGASSNGEAGASDVLPENTKQTKHQTETETETETGSFASLKNPPPDPPPNGPWKQPTDDHLADGYGQFLATLNAATGRSFRGDAVSRGLYLERRRDGRTAAELEAAARGVAMSKHHMGLNKLQVPLNDPKHVLDSGMLDTLIGLGQGDIGLVQEATADEARRARLKAWAAQIDGPQRPELQA